MLPLWHSPRFQAVIIAGLQLTSRQPCWETRTKQFPPLGTNLFYQQILRKSFFYNFDHQHGRLVTWLQAINKATQTERRRRA